MSVTLLKNCGITLKYQANNFGNMPLSVIAKKINVEFLRFFLNLKIFLIIFGTIQYNLLFVVVRVN